MQTFFCKGFLMFMLLIGLQQGSAYAQQPVANKPTTQIQVGAVAAEKYQPLPAQPTININYVRTREAVGRYTSESAFDVADYTGVKQTTQYVDGLGRPIQSVNRQATPGATPKDLVSPIVYDAYGRQVFSYLPYVASTSDGAYKTNASTELPAFLQQQYPGEQMFYGKTIYEASPLNRVEKTFAPGNSWAGTEGEVSERSMQYKYMVNTSADGVRIWDITNSDLTYVNKDITTNIPVARAETYAEGQLYKNVMIDESGNAIVEYKDKEGQVILKKVQIGSISPDYSGYSGFLCTYYIYDDFGSLRFVIPPKAVAALIPSGAWSLNIENIVNELCFRYEYDYRKRLIAKKVPGADWVYMVYDKRDRLVFTQDGNMRGKNQWMTTLYDELNRPVLTGMITFNEGHQALQAYVSAIAQPSQLSEVPVTGTLPSKTAQNLVVYERTTGLMEYAATEDIVFEDGFESEATADFTAGIILPQAGDPASNSISVWNNPIPSTSTLIALTETFYDNYNWTTKTYDVSNNSKLTAGSNLHVEAILSLSQQQAVGTLGMVTGTRTRILEDLNDLTKGAWLESVNFYDDRSRVIQVQSINYKGGLDISTNLYDFSGKVLCNYLVHRYPGSNQADLKVKTEMSYDPGGWLQEIWKTINDDDQNKTLIAAMEYDVLGQQSKKSLGRLKDLTGTYTASPIEELHYNYNIQGWLQGINKDQLGSAAPQSMVRWFSMELNYDWGFDNPQFNGNIAGTKWRTRGDQQRRSYGYTYDKANRILGGDFGQAASGTTYIDDARINFDMLMGDGANAACAYDENGNILSMTQYGLKGLQSKMIDQMTYRYTVGSNAYTNKLMSVRESASINDEKNGLGDFTDRFSETEPQTTSTYAYDVNGNMVMDLHKEIYNQGGGNKTDGIIYNHLNLPFQISVYDPTDNKQKGTISYIYDAAGNKLEKRVVEFPSSTNDNTQKNTRTTYAGGFLYENNQLQFFSHEEGRVRPELVTLNNQKLTKYHYDYFVKDHLGNTRMVLTEEKKQHIYPSATLEGNINATGQPNAINIEKDYYIIDISNVVSKQFATGIPDYTNESNGIPVNNPSSISSANSEKVYKLQTTSGQAVTGLGITLKVMAGDQIDIFGKSYYFDNSTTGTHTPLNVESVIIGLFASGSSVLGTKAITENEMKADGVIASTIGSFLNGPNRGTDDGSTRPKAYINWILFDENLQVAAGSFSRVAATGSLKDHFSELQGIEVKSNGYLYVYCSNESSKAVFFDNLQVVHTSGPLVEETLIIRSGSSCKE